MVAGYKVAAFAQRRTAGVLFQHGSVMLRAIPEEVREALREAGLGTAADWGEVGGAVRPLEALDKGGVGGVRKALQTRVKGGVRGSR